MKRIIEHTILMSMVFALFSCGNAGKEGEHGHEHEGDEAIGNVFHISEKKFNTLEIAQSSLIKKDMSTTVEVTGSLEVPPQNEAVVTAVVGANVDEILVIEGQKIAKGQILAWLSHPELITLQTNYITVSSELSYLSSSYNRQKKLYDEKVGSGKELQEIEAKYRAKKGELKGLEYKLKLLGLNPKSIAEGNIADRAPVKSPIDGYIQKVRVKTAQFVQPEREMFEIINLEHVHADLMVFEKDVHLVKEGQKIIFSTESSSDKQLQATIYSVGKSFEEQPKAVHIHADIENKEGLLLPGMYISGQIYVENKSVFVLPSEAIASADDKFYIFKVLGKEDGEWNFEAVEIEKGVEYDGFTEIQLKEEDEVRIYASNKGYYLLSEWKKDEAGHDHT